MIEETLAFGGRNAVFRHQSTTCECDMVFGIYLPPLAQSTSVPVLWYLSGLTCTHENAMSKAGMQRYAAEHGIALVFPDTSPRGENVANDDAYDLGQGAGFYLNATQSPWAPHFKMYDYVTSELYHKVCRTFPVTEAHGITGHSMGGHGALIIALRNPQKYKSLSAFSPISNPTESDWGKRQLGAYLGDDISAWRDHDSCILLGKIGWGEDVLVDQGDDDQFLELLRPEALAQAAGDADVALTLRRHAGYDHSYYFVSSFAGDHIAWHAERLAK